MKQREMLLLSGLARTGSVTLAAASAGMSQPAASSMLAQLEQKLGVELFTRRRRKLELTAECRALLPEITHALAALESLDRTAQSMGRVRQARLVIGAVPAASASVLPAGVKAVRADYRGISVVVRAGTADEVLEMALKGRIDIGLIYGSARHDRLEFRDLGALDLMCVMRPTHGLAREEAITVEQLMANDYIAHSRHLPVGALTAQAIEAAGGQFAPAVEVMQFSAACAMVEADCGVAVLESLAARYAAAHGLTARPLRAASDLALIAVWSPAKGLTAVSRKLLDSLAETASREYSAES